MFGGRSGFPLFVMVNRKWKVGYGIFISRSSEKNQETFLDKFLCQKRIFKQ